MADSETLRLTEEKRRLEDEEKRLEEERKALETEKAAAEEAERKHRAELEVAERKRVAEEAERKRQAELEAAERKRVAEEAERKRQAELEAAERKRAAEAAKRAADEAERARVRVYLMHFTIVCENERERDAVVQCVKGLSGSDSGGVSNTVDAVSVTEYDAGRNFLGIVQKGYRVRCDFRLSGVGSDVRRPTDRARKIVCGALNEHCQFEGENRIDWFHFKRTSCQQDFRTADGRTDETKNPTSGVRTGF